MEQIPPASDTSGRRPPYKLAGNPDHVEQLNLLIRKSEILLERSIEEERSVSSLTNATHLVHQVADADLKEIHFQIERATVGDLAGQIKCHPTCSHCCHRVPEATVAEVAHIWSVICDDLNPPEIEALRCRVHSYVNATAPFRPHRLAESRVACPMLVQGLCQVYNQRPLSCRGLNSTNISACQAIQTKDLPSSRRPQWSDPVLHTMAIRTGIRLGQFFEGLGTDAVDLGHALHVLMEHPNAVESYMEGKNLFVESVSSSETETLEFAQIASTNGPAYIPPLEESAPSGNLVASETSHLNHQTKEYIQTGDFATYLRSIAGSSVGRRMARITVPRVARSEEEIDRTRQEFLAAIKEFKEAGFSPQESFNALSTHQTMHLPYQGRNDLEILQRHGEFIVDEISRKALPQFAYPREGQRKPGRLRLGYLSGHLNKSNNGRWALQWLKNHSKEIETYCFMVGPDVDQTTERFREHSDHYFWLNRSVPQNARFIRSLDLDVVIFTDIGFYARMTQYASLRLAPVQCTAWGGPETSGMANVDYYLSSEFMEPDNAQEFYTEKLVKLPRTGLLFERENIQIPELGRAHFGLPEDGNLMFMGQSCMKLVPFYDQFFASLTHRAGTELVLLESDPPGASRIVKERLQKLGVRTRWLPPVSSLEYLALMKLADVSIDPHCWSGGNTTVQALTLGTPVVTLPGPFMRSRHSKAFLEQANAKGLIARDEEDFLDLACDFERQRAAIAELDANSLYGDLQVVEALDNFLFSVAGV